MENEYLGSEDLRNTSMDDVLEHHGVLGMKWGVRNADTLRKYGSLNKTRIERKTSFADRAKTRLSATGKPINPASKRQVSRENNMENRSKTEKKASDGPDKDPKMSKDASTQDNTPNNGGNTDVTQPSQSETKTLTYRDVKNPSVLTDAQLDALNRRMQNEITFNERKTKLNEMNKTPKQRRKEAFKKNIAKIGRDVLTDFAKRKLSDTVNTVVGGDSGKKQVKKTTKPVTDTIKKAVNEQKKENETGVSNKSEFRKKAEDYIDNHIYNDKKRETSYTSYSKTREYSPAMSTEAVKYVINKNANTPLYYTYDVNQKKYV